VEYGVKAIHNGRIVPVDVHDPLAEEVLLGHAKIVEKAPFHAGIAARKVQLEQDPRKVVEKVVAALQDAKII
jgi:hypothetical protein